MMEIYFDDLLVDQDYYMSFEDSYHLFDDTFYLGSTASVNAKFQLPLEGWPGNVENVRVYVDGELIYTLKIDEINYNDDNTVTLSLVDVLTHTSTECDFSSLIDTSDEEHPIGITAKQLLQFICNKYQITYEDFNFVNQDVTIYSYDSAITGRQYLQMIAELAGRYIRIDNTGVLRFKKFELSDEVLTYDEVDTYKLSDIITIQRVVYDTGTTKYETSSDESLYTIYLNIDNLFLQVINQSQFNALANEIIGYQFANVEIPTCNKFFEPGITLSFMRNDGLFAPIICSFERNYAGGYVGSYSTNISSTKQSETQVIDDEQNIKRIRQTIDQINNQLTIQAEEISENSGNITSLQIEVGAVRSIFQLTGGSNLIKNSQFLLNDDVWDFTYNDDDPMHYHTELGQGYNSSLIGRTVSLGNIVLRNTTLTSKVGNISNLKLNTVHSLSYYYSQDANTTTTIQLVGKNTGTLAYEKIINEPAQFEQVKVQFTPNDTDYYLIINSSTTLDGYFTIYDLMLNLGDNKSWEPAASEVYSTILKMSQLGLQVYSSGSGIVTLLTSDGFQIRKATDNGDNTITIGEIVHQFTDDKLLTENIEAKSILISKYYMGEITVGSYVHHVEYMLE